LKTEFLVQFDGVTSSNAESEKVIVIAATNRPFELDNAAIRRFPKRIYVQLPDFNARRSLLGRLLKAQNSVISTEDLDNLSKLTDGFSGSDLTALAKDAALMSIRELTRVCDLDEVKKLDSSFVRPIEMKDFRSSLTRIKKSVSPSTLRELEKWSHEYADVSL
jgi:spastin